MYRLFLTAICYNINLKISQLTQIYYQSRAIKSSGDVWTGGLNGVHNKLMQNFDWKHLQKQ